MKILVFALLIASSLAFLDRDDSPFVTKEGLETARQSYPFETYTYEEHPFKDWTVSEVKKLMGVKTLFNLEGVQTPVGEPNGDLPESFNARKKWPNCIHPIRDQGKCGSCWAFAATEVLSDRFCIASHERTNVVLSPQDLVSCDYFDLGCHGGNPFLSWVFLRYFGVVTESCKPYTSGEGKVEKCPLFKSECKDGSTFRKFKAATIGKVSKTINDIKRRLMEEGPMETGFQVYSDFMNYKGGIYVKTSNQLLGGHAVKIVGWGIEDGTEYWIVANSWGTSWGENGSFRIKMGECGIDANVIAANPKL